jgi:hypothetical protein
VDIVNEITPFILTILEDSSDESREFEVRPILIGVIIQIILTEVVLSILIYDLLFSLFF